MKPLAAGRSGAAESDPVRLFSFELGHRALR